LLKFRTLWVNEDSDTTWSVDDDARQTVLGRFLRKTSLDELPQLINVIRGDMSLVGPRPERPHFCEEFASSVPHYGDRHRVPTGITGWAQIHGLRGDTSIEERARFDNQYIERWTLWSDLGILCRTVPAVLRQAMGRRRCDRQEALPSLPVKAREVLPEPAGFPSSGMVVALFGPSGPSPEKDQIQGHVLTYDMGGAPYNGVRPSTGRSVPSHGTPLASPPR
jgi:hypothetical protein